MTEPILPKAILLDLDDTILAFDAGADQCWHDVCERFAPHLADEISAKNLYAVIDESRTWFWSDSTRHREGRMNLAQTRHRIVARALQQLNVNQPELVEQIADTYIAARSDSIKPFPGAIETVRKLKNRGVRLALLTNGEGVEQRRKINKFSLAPLFDHIHIEGEEGFGKPDERVYRSALHALYADPIDAWIVGDNLEWEVAAPQRLGIFSIWIDAKRTGLPTDSSIKPDRIIYSLTELLDS